MWHETELERQKLKRLEGRWGRRGGVALPPGCFQQRPPSLEGGFLGVGFAVGGEEDGDLGALVDLTGDLG